MRCIRDRYAIYSRYSETRRQQPHQRRDDHCVCRAVDPAPYPLGKRERGKVQTMRCGFLKEGMAMRRSGKVYVLLAIVVGAALCAFAVFVIARRPTAAARPTLYPYPPNARQLIAAGLTGRPAAASPTSPVSIEWCWSTASTPRCYSMCLSPLIPKMGGLATRLSRLSPCAMITVRRINPRGAR